MKHVQCTAKYILGTLRVHTVKYKYMFVHTMNIYLHTGIDRNILLQNMFIPDIYMYIDGIFKFSFL